jgi:hypothetical protein
MPPGAPQQTDDADLLTEGTRSARASRAFMHRAARFAAGAGIRQFLDVGTGIPTRPNLHQVVQEVAPESRVLYVDRDPIVLAHAAALMVGDPRGRTEYLHADARDPLALLDAAGGLGILDLSRPVSVSVIGLLHVLDDEVATRLVGTLLAAVPSGSFVALTNTTRELDLGTIDDAAHLRSRAEIERLFLTGLDVVAPGVVPVHRWRPDADATTEDGTPLADVPDAEISVYGAVACKL